MGEYKQANRKISVTTPLGPDDLLLVGFSGTEAVSYLSSFRLQLLATNETKVPFEALLGQPLTVHLVLPDETSRHHFNGICSSFGQGERGDVFTAYQAEMVPQVWLLTRKAQSRIFQHLSVPDILRKVLEGFPVSFELSGTFEPRDFCVQYRETDFNFVSRLMEEEGIYYFFKHADGQHTMVVANSPVGHPALPGTSSFVFESIAGGVRDDDRITSWEKVQSIRSGKVTLWDYSFEMPRKHLEAESTIVESVQVGKESHNLRLAGTEKLEIYDFPGEYAQRFDGINRSGGEQPIELQKIFRDSQRTAGIRMQQEEMPALLIEGSSNVKHLMPGHRFSLRRHFNGDGSYVLTSVSHLATEGGYGSGDESPLSYQNSFTCIPSGLAFRPPRTTPKPVVQGTQTAVVVGPPGEEIFTDRFGRVKVQFEWDREGKHDVDSSCWVRVATFWAGKNWGAVHLPRIGQEVIVDFIEGDPDAPIIVGSVYNAEEMPPYKLPDWKTMSTVKSRSTPDSGPAGFNEIRFEDHRGKEQVFVHAQKRMDVRVLGSLYETVHANRHEVVGLPKGTEKGGDYDVTVGGNHSLHVRGGLYEGIGKALNSTVKAEVVHDHQTSEATLVSAKSELNAREITLEALQKITLKVGSSFVVLDLMGVTISGPMVKINSGGAATGTGDPSIEDPHDAETSDTGEPGYLDRPRTGGGGGGWKKRTLHSQHGPDVTRNADGSYQVGKAVKIDGSDPAFTAGALNDIAIIGTTPKGQALLKDLDGSGHTVELKKRPANPADPFNAETTAKNGPDANSVATGGTGKGTDTSITYDPSVWPPPKTLSPTQTPSDVTLFHEMTHANHHTHGTRDGTPRADNFDNQEEFNTISDEQQYRGQRTPKVDPLTNGHHEL
jgi:type VI secretion system secreted protein VgrG